MKKPREYDFPAYNVKENHFLDEPELAEKFCEALRKHKRYMELKLENGRGLFLDILSDNLNDSLMIRGGHMVDRKDGAHVIDMIIGNDQQDMDRQLRGY